VKSLTPKAAHPVDCLLCRTQTVLLQSHPGPPSCAISCNPQQDPQGALASFIHVIIFYQAPIVCQAVSLTLETHTNHLGVTLVVTSFLFSFLAFLLGVRPSSSHSNKPKALDQSSDTDASCRTLGNKLLNLCLFP
jgi:hypothetical protein